MAIIYVDKFSTTLAVEVASTDTSIWLEPADAAALVAAMNWAPSLSDWNRAMIGAQCVRLPLIIDNGTAMELLDVTAANSMTGEVQVARASPLDWASATTIRCAPAARRTAEGHLTARPTVEVSDTYAIPGERVIWSPAASDDLTLRLATLNSWPGSTEIFLGETWPAEIVIGNASVARTLYLMDFDAVYPVNVAQAAGRSSIIALPDTCRVAVVRITKLPLAIRTGFGAPAFTATVELYS